MQSLLTEIRDTLKLEGSIRKADKMILSACASLWVSLVGLESDRLRAYGEVPLGLGEYLDPKLVVLNEHLRVISNAAGQSLRR